MFKMVGLLKRKSGLTSEAFREYYETYHRVIGEKYLRGRALKYMRRYTTGFPDAITGLIAEPVCDVILEIWYPDRATFEATMQSLSAPAIAAEIAEDEEKLFDRKKNTFYWLDEVESVMDGGSQA